MSFDYKEFIEFSDSFKKGYKYVLWNSTEENRENPTVNMADINSIGYNLGFQYGEYCELTSQTMSISQEQMIAIIDKSYTRALYQRQSYFDREEKYGIYRVGFVKGRNDILDKYENGDESFNIIPDLDITDIEKVGYYDGYCYYLNEVLHIEGLHDRESDSKLDKICRESFNDSFITYSFDKIKINEKAVSK